MGLNKVGNPLPPVYRFDFGDYASLGAMFQKFLGNLNLFTLNVYNLLNGNIGFSNLQREVYTTSVIAGTTTPLSFVNPLSVAPSGITVCRVVLTNNILSAITTAISAANWTFDGKNINITDIVGLTAGSKYTISLEVF